MIIYIPNHLEKLPIIEQFSKMVQGYSELQQDSLAISGSFDYYYSYYSNDYIRKFIELSLNLNKDYNDSGSIDSEDSEIRENIINYLVKLFYSVKGTNKVFEYMKEFLGIEFIGDIRYTINEVAFEIAEVTTLDISVYIKTMKEFLSALLFYYDLDLIIDLMNLKLKEILSLSVSADIQKYKEFTVSARGLI